METISFEDLGLDETTLAAVAAKGFEAPSPIQVLAIPRLLNGDANVIAKARTGTGKTAAFGLPLVQTIRSNADHVQALILTPTRELALQVCREIQSFATGDYPRLTAVYGGAAYGEQLRSLRRGTEIVVGTPGRVKDHLERGTLSLSGISYFILDEADEMLDMGFIDDIETIFSQANPDSRILLFSATMPPPILKIAAKFMGDYEIVQEEERPEEPILTEQRYWIVRESEKIEALVRLIDISADFYGLVFTQTKMDADAVSRQLDERGYEAAALHGDIPQSQREKILSRFRRKKTRILVATDVAARGIDIEGLTHVVNYAMPFDGPTYIHRIGRTGRAGAKGVAYTFVRPEERRKLEYLRSATRKATKGPLEEESIPSVARVLEVKRARLFEEMKKALGIENDDAETSAAGNPPPEENQDSAAAELQSGTAAAKNADETEAPAADNAAAHSEQLEAAAEEKPRRLSERKTGSASPEFLQMAEELCRGGDPLKVLAEVLALTYGKSLDPARYGNISSGKSSAGAQQIRLYATLGRRDGYNPRGIAEYFSSLLHIPQHFVDKIDMAENFSLFSLPVKAGKELLDLSKRDSSCPHIHVDTKEAGGNGRMRSGFSRGGGRRSFADRRDADGRGVFRRDSRRFSGGKQNKNPEQFVSGKGRTSNAGLYRKSASKPIHAETEY
ncbi:MAG: DEAD/DEAH box helicase [Bacteroides sp.]|nr:DEAD/DEAH box helicase [Prevotella sp.]MCM1408631.1 DEAD/DEAH box helicase [Treponema brennaborense]MCM1470705.1 DEAD/DEAH box helicase [Bacteroides sp.]